MQDKHRFRENVCPIQFDEDTGTSVYDNDAVRPCLFYECAMKLDCYTDLIPYRFYYILVTPDDSSGTDLMSRICRV